MKSINHRIKPVLIAVLVAIISFVLLMFFGCNPAKQLTKAENKVLANVESVERVRAKTDALYPCNTDTIVSDQHDTTYIPSPPKYIRHIDTLRRNDTVYFFQTDTAEFEKIRTITNTKIVTDTREVNKLKDTITNLRIQREWYKSTNNEKNETISAAKKERNTLLWWAIGIGVLGVLSHVGRSYLKL